MLMMTAMASAAGQDSWTGANQAAPLPALTIRFIDNVGIGTAAFADFRDQAAAALRTAGIESVWVHCPAAPFSTKNESCDAAPLDTDVLLTLLPESSCGEREAMGSAFPGDRGKGVLARLYFSKIDRTARRSGVPVNHLMALAAVHEIGHLLAGREHDMAGLMQAHWSEREIHCLLTRGGLKFKQWTAKRLQEGMAARSNQMRAEAK
jgi:hypothetical protein